MVKQNSILKNIFISVLSFAVLLCLSFSFTACGGGPNMTQSYSFARESFKEVSGITLPEQSGVEASFNMNVSGFHMSVTKATTSLYDSYLAQFKKQLTGENWAVDEGEPVYDTEDPTKVIEIEATFNNSTEHKGFRITYDGENKEIYVNFVADQELDVYDIVKTSVKQLFDKDLPDWEYDEVRVVSMGCDINPLVIYFDFEEGVTENADMFADLTTFFEENLLEEDGWVVEDTSYSSTTTGYYYNNNETGLGVSFMYDSNGDGLWCDIGWYGYKVADTFGDAKTLLKQTHGISLPSFGNAQITLGENHFNVAGDHTQVKFSSTSFTEENYDAVVDVFNAKFGNYETLEDDDLGGRDFETAEGTQDVVGIYTWWQVVDEQEGYLTQYAVEWNVEGQEICVYVQVFYP